MLSEYVQRIMKQKGLSLADVERNCGKEITAGYIGKVLKGTVTNLTVDKIVALARGLDADPYEVFAAAYGKPPLNQAHPDPYLLLEIIYKLLKSPDLLEAMPDLLRLAPKERKVIFQPLSFGDRKRSKKRNS